MATSSFVKLASFLVVCMVVASPLVDAAITCGQVTSKLAPCVPYARGPGSGPVPPGCCSGIKGLNAAAQTTPDRQTACKCLKTLSTSVSGINYGLVAGIPGKCGVSIPYKISPSTNCDRCVCMHISISIYEALNRI